ncbi:Flavohemoprotein like [Verticillium longisporum]|nr:Flavohemoprotein like [Verticillium longisporum]
MSYLASSRSLLRNSRAVVRLPTTIARTFSSTTPNMAMTEAQTAIVKSTAPILKEHGTTITTVFYKSMLGAHPELRNVFNLSNQRSGAQQKALANAVLAYATHIDELQKLGPAVERIAQKHVSLGVTPDQYAIVGEHLIKAIATVLGDGLTPEVADAWVAAYGQLADIFVKREGDLYDQAGDWRGWRKFRIDRRQQESNTVTSFYLKPAEGDTSGPLPPFLPGQYVSVRVRVPEYGDVWQCRQYSMSEAPQGDHYRISVKRERAAEDAGATSADHPGVVSNILHDKFQVGDEIEITYPRGEFFIDVNDATKADAPLVLLSAGVGVTPLTSILDAVLAGPESKMTKRPIRWVHAARRTDQMAFAAHIKKVTADNANVKSKVFLNTVVEGEEQGRAYDFKGRLDLDVLDGAQDLGLNSKETDYFVCGPQAFMVEVLHKLEALGVERARVRLELFGTGDAEDL